MLGSVVAAVERMSCRAVSCRGPEPEALMASVCAQVCAKAWALLAISDQDCSLDRSATSSAYSDRALLPVTGRLQLSSPTAGLYLTNRYAVTYLARFSA